MPAALHGGMRIENIPTEKSKPALSVNTVKSRLPDIRHRVRNTAVMHAILQRDMARSVKIVDERAFSYIAAIAAARQMRNSGILTDKDKFDMVQAEIERHSRQGRWYSRNSIFSSKLSCGDCDGLYSSKVWRSNDAYRRVVWQCNRKFSKGVKARRGK